MTSQTKTNGAFVIEKGISTPVINSGRGHPKYPFAVMEIGDSFALSREQVVLVRVSASQHSKRHGKRFTVTTDAKGDYRCWRIA